MSLAQYEDGIDGCGFGKADADADDDADDEPKVSAIGACTDAFVARIGCAFVLAALRGRASADMLRGAELAAGAGRKASSPEPAGRCVCAANDVAGAVARGASSFAARVCGGADL